MKIHLELSGGLELLFGKVKTHEVDLPDTKEDGAFTMQKFISYVRDNMVKERPELFATAETVRPGILVLINDSDWELEGTLAYELQEGDTITFISTLHGG